MRRHRFTASALAVLACAVLAAGASAVAPGDFDPSFASNGTFIQPLGEGARPGAILYAVAVQPDAKIVVTGVASDSKEVVARLNPDGTLDPTFGTGGKVLTTFGTSSTEFATPYAVAIQPDGKIVIAGTFTGTQNQVLLARLNPDGSFDPSFGSNGMVVTQLGEGTTNPFSSLGALALQPDGKILAAGGATNSSNEAAVLVGRWNTDGSPDGSFGTAGKATPQLGEGASAGSGAAALALQPDGKIVIAGSGTETGDTQQNSALVARLDPDGKALDPTFGTGGKFLSRLGLGAAAVNILKSVALQPDGKIVVGGDEFDAQSHDHALVARLNVDGQGLDPGFAGGGPFTTQLGEGGTPQSALAGIVLQPDGKILGAGSANGPKGDLQVLVARLASDGALDSSFNGDGKVLTQLGVANSFYSSIALDPNKDKVVVAGSVQDNTPDNHALVSRLILQLPPTAAFTAAPNPVDAGLPVAFDGSGSTDPDGMVVGYDWDFGDGTTATGPTASHSYGAPGSYTAKLTVRDDYGSIASSTQAITVNPAPMVNAPALSSLSLKPSVFPAAAGKGASATRRRKTGTTVRYTDSQAATTTFTVARVLPGRKQGRRCVRPTRRNAKAKRCTRYVRVRGSFGHNDRAGANRFHFTGRMRRRALRPGKYRLSATPFAGGKTGRTLTKRFRIIR